MFKNFEGEAVTKKQISHKSLINLPQAWLECVISYLKVQYKLNELFQTLHIYLSLLTPK